MLSKLDLAIEHAISLTDIGTVKRCENCGHVLTKCTSKGREAEICFSCRQLTIQGQIKFKGWKV